MNQKYATLFGIGLSAALFIGCEDMKKQTRDAVPVADSVLTEVFVPETEQVLIIPPLMPEDIILTKEFLYDKYTLEDIYPYKDTTRSFKWETIRKSLAFVENFQQDPGKWVVLQNYKNVNQYPPLVKKYTYNKDRLVSDTLGVSRYQSVPLYSPEDTLTPELYGPDGSIARYLGQTVQKSIFACLNPDPGCGKSLCLCKFRTVRGSSDASGIHPQQHMHHRTVGRHVDLPDLLFWDFRLVTYLCDHAIDGVYDCILQFPDSGLGMLILVGNPGQHIQPIMLLGIDHRRTCKLLP